MIQLYFWCGLCCTASTGENYISPECPQFILLWFNEHHFQAHGNVGGKWAGTYIAFSLCLSITDTHSPTDASGTKDTSTCGRRSRENDQLQVLRQSYPPTPLIWKRDIFTTCSSKAASTQRDLQWGHRQVMTFSDYRGKMPATWSEQVINFFQLQGK